MMAWKYQGMNDEDVKSGNPTERLPLCDPDWIRTNDPQLRRLMLYPAELPDRHFRAANIPEFFSVQTKDHISNTHE